MLINKRETPGKRKEQAIHYVKKNHVDTTVIRTVTSVMNSKLDYQLLERKGENEMFTVFEETYQCQWNLPPEGNGLCSKQQGHSPERKGLQHRSRA